jgi:hypothetical protein
LPAVNTPQSERQRNKMPKRQQPVPPLFTPESVAEAIVRAADEAPREVFVALPTAAAVWGQKFIPGLLDRHLATAGWEPQFVDEPNTQTDDILFHTLPGDPGAHGPYRERETGPDLQMRVRSNPAPAGLAAAGLALAAMGLLLGRHRLHFSGSNDA